MQLFISLLLLFKVGTLDSLVVYNFESHGVTIDETQLITNTFKTELEKHFPIVSLKKFQPITIRTFDEAIEICKTNNIPIIVGGEVNKIADKYRIQAIYLDLAKNKSDTIVAITSSPLATISHIANSFFKLAIGEEEKDFGSISFETTPKGADILLDGELIGTTPEKIDLILFGQHSILFSKKGYVTAVKPIVVYPGRKLDISLPLTPMTGSLIAPSDKAPVYWIDEVVVRGRKIKEEIFTIPRGVDVITSKDIEYSGAKNIPDLLSGVAGISIRDKTGSGVNTSLSIRGMDPSKYTVVTLDGIVINRIDGEVNWNSIPMEIVKRIEVIKGTSSSSCGGNAVGGVINIITKERGKNKLSISSTNAKDGGWALTLSTFADWALWVNTNGRKGYGWRKFDDAKNEEYDIRSFYGKFTFPIDKENTVAFSLDAINKKNLFPGGLDLVTISKTPEYYGNDREDKSWENVRFTSRYEMKTSEAKLLFKFYTMPQGYESKGIKKWSFKGIEIGTSTEYEYENFVFLIDGSFSNLRRRVHYPFSTLESDDNSQNFTVRTLLEWKEKMFKVLTLTPGIKFEWVKYRLNDYMNTLPSREQLSPTFTLSPKFGLIWSSMSMDIFSSMERTIRLPKPYEKVKNIKLKPEVITSVEIGARTRYYALTGSISLFSMSFKDQILLEGATFVNFPQDAFHRGIEGGLNYIINKKLSFFSTHTLLEAKFEEGNLWIPNVPKMEHTFGMKITYMPIYSTSLNYHWHDKSYIDIENNYPQTDAYGTLDFTFKVKPYNFCSFVFGITNLTGEEDKKIFGYEAPIELGKKEGLYYPITPRGFRILGNFEF